MVDWLYYDLSQGCPGSALEKMIPMGLEGFGFAPDRLEFVNGYLQETLARAQHLLLAEGMGFFIFSQPEALHKGMVFLWIDAVVILPKYQGQGLSYQATCQIIDTVGRERVGWVAGRTQSPYAMRALGKLGPLRPFEQGFDDPEGDALIDYIRAHVAQTNQLEHFDRSTGIQVGAYGESLLPQGLKDSGTANPLDHERGDVYICVCQLR